MSRALLGGAARRHLVAEIDAVGADVARRIANGEIDDDRPAHYTADGIAWARARAGADVELVALCGFRGRWREPRADGAVCLVCAAMFAAGQEARR